MQVLLILCTFAIGGSLTGYAGRRLMPLFSLDSDWSWIIVYIILVTLLWPLSVLLVSIPFGQFRFFTHYLGRMGRRMGLGRPVSSSSRARIAIFASGAGSNAARIIEKFRDHPFIEVALIACNKPGAGVLQIAEKEKIPALLIKKEAFFRGNGYVKTLKDQKIDFIVLAGFLWKMPPTLLAAYPDRIINIHPALLPLYGGKGMYGRHVHEAVIAAGDMESGITIHYVDEKYDNGPIILQARCPVYKEDTPDSLALRIHGLEHSHYPEAIESWVKREWQKR